MQGNWDGFIEFVERRFRDPKDRLAFEKAKRECANGVFSSCAAANIYAEKDQKSNDILADGLTKC